MFQRSSAHLSAGNKRDHKNRRRPRGATPYAQHAATPPRSWRPLSPSAALTTSVTLLNLRQRQKLTSSRGRQILFAESGGRKGVCCSPDHKSTDESTGAGGGGGGGGNDALFCSPEDSDNTDLMNLLRVSVAGDGGGAWWKGAGSRWQLENVARC